MIQLIEKYCPKGFSETIQKLEESLFIKVYKNWNFKECLKFKKKSFLKGQMLKA